MILELDCGNTLIKWRVVRPGGLKVLAGVAQGGAQLIADVVAAGLEIRAIRLVSVRSATETDALLEELKSSFAVPVVQAVSALELAGVRNGYEDYRRLGLDRWLALVAAYRDAAGAVLVIDLGTAITADFVTAEGRHLGGFICPGMPLMRNQLRSHTSQIRYSDEEAWLAGDAVLPGTGTAEAVERGCRHMVTAFIERQVALAKTELGAYTLYLTGGDAGCVAKFWPEAQCRSELVFDGLALACPLGEN